MSPVTFLRMMRGMRGKIGTTDNVSLIEWANRHVKGVDQRIDRPERSAAQRELGCLSKNELAGEGEVLLAGIK